MEARKVNADTDRPDAVEEIAPADSCPHPDGYRTEYTGTLCAACYREIEMRLPGLAAYCKLLRIEAAPGAVSATRLAERVQESKEQRLLIDEHRVELADDLYRAAVHVVLVTSERIYAERPFYLQGAAHAPEYRDTIRAGHTAQSVESWIARNLWLIVALPDAWQLLAPVVDALTKARRTVDPSPPRRPVIRGACGVCLSGRVTIEVRTRAVFYSTCGGCGNTGPIHAREVEAVLHGDGDRSGEGDRPNSNDAMAVSS